MTLIEYLEKKLYQKVIDKFNQDLHQVADFLGVSIKTVRNKIHKYKLKYISKQRVKYGYYIIPDDPTRYQHPIDAEDSYWEMWKRYPDE